jgi:hypothetical protein
MTLERGYKMTTPSTSTPTPPTDNDTAQKRALAMTELADEFDDLLSSALNKKINHTLVDHCAFLDRVFERFSKNIDDGDYTYIPTSSYDYVFKAMEHYRATYGALQSTAQEWKRLALAEQRLNAKKTDGDI